MIAGTSQADVALIMVPCDVKQIAIGCNKMDCDMTGYQITRYEDVSNEMKSMLVKVGWKKEVVERPVPFLRISGWIGDNLNKIQDCKGVAWIGGMASMLMSMAQR